MTITDVDAFLTTYHNFDDCALLGIDWRDHGHTVDFVINNIYRPDGSLRDNLDVEERVTIRFTTVLELCIANGFTRYQLEHLGEIEWSHNIFSQIKLEVDSERLLKYEHLEWNIHHLSILWENEEKRVDIVFSGMEYFWKAPHIQGL